MPGKDQIPATHIVPLMGIGWCERSSSFQALSSSQLLRPLVAARRPRESLPDHDVLKIYRPCGWPRGIDLVSTASFERL